MRYLTLRVELKRHLSTQIAYLPCVEKVPGIVDVAELVGEKRYLIMGATKRNKHLGNDCSFLALKVRSDVSRAVVMEFEEQPNTRKLRYQTVYIC